MPEQKEKHDKMLSVLLDFRVLVRSMKRHYQGIEKQTGIGGALVWALSEIEESPGLMASELAERLAIHRSTASNMLKKLVSLGLVTRDRTNDDQRSVRLHLTTKGRRILLKAPRPFVGVLQQALLDLPEARINALGRELSELLKVMQRKDLKAKGAFLANA